MGLTVTWKKKKLVMKQLVLNEGCSIDMACFMSRNNTAVQSFCDFKTMLKKQDVRVVPPSLHRYCSDKPSIKTNCSSATLGGHDRH